MRNTNGQNTPSLYLIKRGQYLDQALQFTASGMINITDDNSIIESIQEFDKIN